MNTADPIRSVAVVGSGIVALSTAAALRIWLPQIAVTLVPAPVADSAWADRTTYLPPSSRHFLRWIGLDEGALCRSGAARPVLGFRFEEWPLGAPAWTLVYDSGERGAGPPILHHFWAAQARITQAAPFHHQLMAGALAEAKRFAFPNSDLRSPFATYDYGLQIDPAPFHAALHRHAMSLGMVVADRDAVADHDLTIDCVRPITPDAFEDWGMPVDRTGKQPMSSAASPLIALRGGPNGVRADDAASPSGRHRAPWHGDLLLMGDAALVIGPLMGLGIQAAHNAIRRAIDLLPDRTFASVETDDYNRRTALEASRIRDFLALLHAPWGAAGTPTLAARIDAFEHNGLLPHHDEDGVSIDSWIGALIGMGHLPRHIAPRLAGVNADAWRDQLAQRAAHLAAIADTDAALPR